MGFVVGPSAFSAGLVGEVVGFDGVFDGVGAVECALDALVVFGLALDVSLGGVAAGGALFAAAGGGVVFVEPLFGVHAGSFGLLGPVFAACGFGGGVHDSFCLCAGFVPFHHVQVVHEGVAEVYVVGGGDGFCEGDDDAYAGLVGCGGVGGVDDAAHADGFYAFCQFVDAGFVCVVAV